MKRPLPEPALVVSPTPVMLARHVSEALGCEVYVKRDDQTHALYGGNKVRKLALLLADARARGATALLTVGAHGSHHVLATAVHGRAVGFPVTAVVVPRPDAPEVQQAHQATLAQECRLVPASSEAAAVPRLVREWWRLKRAGHRPYFLPPGGSSPLGAVGYVRAMEELARQHEHGELPSWPDVIVCVLGSGATFAGLVAGTRAVDRPCRVLGVGVWSRPAANRPALAWMARSALRLAQPSHSAPPPRARELAVDLSQLGDGYGHATPAARDAQALFAHDGITLEGTYTGKAAAALVALARGGADRPRRLLFWHSHSSAPLAPLLRASASAGEPGRDRTG